MATIRHASFAPHVAADTRLLILGSLYANREDVIVGVSTTDLTLGSRALLSPYRVQLGV